MYYENEFVDHLPPLEHTVHTPEPYQHEGRLTLEEVKRLPLGTKVAVYNRNFKRFIGQGEYRGVSDRKIIIDSDSWYLSDCGLIPYEDGWNPANCLIKIS